MPNTQSTNLDLDASLQAARTRFETKGFELLNSILPGAWQLYTDKVTAPQGLWQNDVLANIPIMEPWDAAKVEKTLRAYQQQIEARRYAARLPIYRRTFTRDSGGQVGRAIDGFFATQEHVHDKYASDALHESSGVGPTGYDGVSLFNASHPHVNSGSGHSNLSAGTNFSHANYSAARQVFNNRIGENGEPIGPFVVSDVECAPVLTPRVKEVLDISTVVKFHTTSATEATEGAGDAAHATSQQNIWEGDARIIENHRISSADQYHWTLMDNTRTEKLIIMINERDTEAYSYTDMKDPERRDNDRFIFDLEADFLMAAGFWMLGYRCTGTQ